MSDELEGLEEYVERLRAQLDSGHYFGFSPKEAVAALAPQLRRAQLADELAVALRSEGHDPPRCPPHCPQGRLLARYDALTTEAPK